MNDPTRDDAPAPHAGPVRREDLNGLEYVLALKSGAIALSPMARNIGWRFVDVKHGEVRLAVTPGPHLYNNKTVHGGAMATMLDGAMAAAVNSTCARGVRAVTIELKVSLVEAPQADTGELTIVGRVVHTRRTLALAEARIEGPDGVLYCHGTATFLMKYSREQNN